MKNEYRFLLFMSAFCAVIGVLFWAVGLPQNYREMTGGGTTMLIGVALFCGLPGLYYLWWSKRMSPRAEDDASASVEQGAGVVGSFPSSSIWPFCFGLGAAFVGLALVFGFWTAIFGFFLVITATVGVVMESRRGASPL